MNDPVSLIVEIQDYFDTVDVPTIPSFLNFIGILRPQLEKMISNPKALNEDQERSLYYILQAIQVIEADILDKGLCGDIKADLTKFTLNAYHGVIPEKHEHKTTDESRTLTIRIESTEPASEDEMIEMERIKQEVYERARISYQD
jgi:hypothetical protein